MKKIILVCSIAFLAFLLGRFTAPNSEDVLSQIKLPTPEANQETEQSDFSPLSLDVTYFNSNNIRWGSAEHYKEFEEGDIRQYSQLALANTAIYQSYPTTKISLTDYDNSIRDLEVLPLEKAIGLLKEDCGMDWPVQTARENYQKYGDFTTYTLPNQEIYEINYFDVDGDNKNETIVHKNYNCRADDGSTSADIVKDNKIIFSATGDDSTILPADTNNGFYLEQRLDDGSARCCSTGLLRTRFVYKEEKFVPIYEQEVKYMMVKEISE
jgi:hypothetical protein